MITILIIDDKPARYAGLIERVSPSTVPHESFSFRSSVKDAIEAMEEKAYDLIVVDMMLPSTAWGDPEGDGGATLLELLTLQDDIHLPRYVVGVTAAEIDDAKVAEAFSRNAWSLLRTAGGDISWIERLTKLIEYIKSRNEQAQKIEYIKDICIVTALRKPEFMALRNLPVTWSEDLQLDSNTFVNEAIISSGQTDLSVVAASCSKMGTVEAALLSSKLIQKYRPRLLVMTGICAGVEGKANIGDVIVANPTWDWQSVKISKMPNKEPVVMPALDFISVERELLNRLSLLGEDHVFLNEVRQKWIGDAPSSALQLLSGPMASGSVLVADGETIAKVKATQNKDLLALEMEAYAIYAAARIAHTPKPLALAMKSVCDFGNYLKDDRFQKYAAYTSAACLFEFIKRFGGDLRQLIR